MVLLISLLLLVFAPSGVLPQSCSCSGRGVCGPTLTCACNQGWYGPTCASRRCPMGRAWVGYGGGGTDDVHTLQAECSGWGTCSTSTGVCVCPPGVSGEACQYLACPTSGGSPCSGKGRCMSMVEAASAGNGDGYLALPFPASTYGGWEGGLVMGCVCDPGFTGPDCATAACPYGADPLVPALPKVQAITCSCNGGMCSGGAFSLSFGGRTATVLAAAVAGSAGESPSAPPGSGWAVGESLQSVLGKLMPGGVASVVYTGGVSSACGAGAGIAITFSPSLGGTPSLVLGQGTLSGPLPINLNTYTLQASTVAPLPCSGRGKCMAGTCVCYPGYFPSDGSGGPGALGDCGSLVPPGGTLALNATKVGACLGSATSGTSTCNNRGWCDRSGGGFVCQCSKGYWGPACEFRSCPVGRAWWDQPAPDGTAHAMATCSNRGVCGQDGTCTCFPGYTGSSCSRMACPSTQTTSTPCSGTGRCVVLSELVSLGSGGGLPMGGVTSKPPIQTLTCSLGSGYLYFTLKFVKTPPIPFNAPLGVLALALENIPGVGGGVVITPTPAFTALPGGGWGYTTPTTLCSGTGGGTLGTTLTITFTGVGGGALEAMTLSASGQASGDTGEARVGVVSPGSMPSYGADPFSLATWDAGMIQGCHCDGYPEWNSTGSGGGVGAGGVSGWAGGVVDRGKWYGPSCAQRACPSGVIPETSPLGPLAPFETQALTCASGVVSGGSFTLGFRGRTTIGIDWDASSGEITAALQGLPSIGLVKVTQTPASGGDTGGGGVCSPTTAITTIVFLTEVGGGLPLLTVDTTALQWNGGGGGAGPQPPASSLLTVSRLAAGVGETAECSGRGVCDTALGVCNCRKGYTSSDGRGGSGSRGDCGKPWGAGGV